MYYSNQKIIKNKIGLLNLAEELENVSKACKVMGLSRDTFYRYKSVVNEDGVSALIEKNRRQPNLKNRVDGATEQAVSDFAIEFPAYGQLRASNELRKQGVFVSPSGVRWIWLRNNLGSMRQRLKELERRSANENFILTESQVTALEKKKDDDLACGEIETAHPGYLGSQDTFYVGTLKGVGRVYQQAFVDTYSKIAHCKLYTTKTPITAADLLNDRVLPFMEEHGVGLLRILTDRGTEYCGKVVIMNYILLSMVLSIQKQKRSRHKPMVFVRGFIERSSMNFIKSRFGVRSIRPLNSCKKIWTIGWNIIIINELTKGKCALVEHRSKHCLRGKRSARRKLMSST